MLAAGCTGDESVGAETCSLSPTIAFQGREYTAADAVGGLSERQVKVGHRLGAGETSACSGDDGQRVQVFKVVGVPVKRAVHAEPVYGLMMRSHLDER